MIDSIKYIIKKNNKVFEQKMLIMWKKMLKTVPHSVHITTKCTIITQS